MTIEISSASSTSNALGCGDQHAARAGLDVLRSGGNAADAAVAIILTLSISRIGLCCIGGEAVSLVYDSGKGDTKVVCGHGTSPSSDDAISWYMTNGIPSGNSIASATVPAIIDFCVSLLAEFGTSTFAETAQYAMKLLTEGRPSAYKDSSYGRLIDALSGQRLPDNHTSANDDGVWAKNLLTTLEQLCRSEAGSNGDRQSGLRAVSDCFYRGDIADALDAWYRKSGGWLRRSDLEQHTTRLEEPCAITYRGYTILKPGPWSQGPFLLQTLSLMEQQDPNLIMSSDVTRSHLILESMKQAFADRDEYYGDPDFTDVPLRQLLSGEYAELRSSLVDRNRVATSIRAGDPVQMRPSIDRAPRSHPVTHGTTPIVVADTQGNIVTVTFSGCGSKAGSGGLTGITHGIRLRSFNTWANHPNCIEKQKRPRSTLSPTLVLKYGKPVLAISCTTGDLQEQLAIQLIIDILDRGISPSRAVSAPRIYSAAYISSFGPIRRNSSIVRYDDGMLDEVVKGLERIGHKPWINQQVVGRMILHLEGNNKNIYGWPGCCLAA